FGINAADALTVAQTAIGLLRQHIRQGDRIHGIVTDGGDAPNIVPAHAAADYIVRARALAELDEIRAKVLRCFEAGALATGATLPADQAVADGALALAWTALDVACDPALVARLCARGR